MLRPRAAFAIGALSALAMTTGARSGGPPGIDSTLDDFFQPGTQPQADNEEFIPIVSSSQCQICHGSYDVQAEPYRVWAATMMGQSARDPIFHASLAIANQDATDGGAYCIRCHAPVAFLNGNHVPTDGSAFTSLDEEGINCNFCHRVVDQVYVDGVSPAQDEAVIEDLVKQGLLPPEGSNARFVVDPADSRRGPFDDVPVNVHLGFPQPEVIHSPHHQMAEFCWTCHDVSNPLLERQPDGTFQLGPLGEPHSTAEQDDMLPLHRTYKEWLNSYYPTIGVQHNGRFGGNHPTGVMKVCQDCHMPDQEAFGCSLGDPFFERQDVPQHSFIGSNTWVLDAVRSLYPDEESGLTEETVDNQIARNIDMLEKASDLTLTQFNDVLRTRVMNRTGHKLPTGFPDGRRMWINVKFFTADETLIEEIGAYDFAEATLDDAGTTVYEAVLGVDEAQAAATGLPEGPTFHFLLANTILKDNRIPPTGHFNSVSEQNGTLPVGVTFQNGQHWHDTNFAIPSEARMALVTVYYQTTTREFIEFLRDANTTNGTGQVAYDQWVLHGMSSPVVMDLEEIDLNPLGDLTGDGAVDVNDLLYLFQVWGPCPPPQFACPPDLDGDGQIGVTDLLILLDNWGM